MPRLIQERRVARFFVLALALLGVSGCCKIVPFLSRCKTPSLITSVQWSTAADSNGNLPVVCRILLLTDTLEFARIPTKNLFRETSPGSLAMTEIDSVSSFRETLNPSNSGLIEMKYPVALLDLSAAPDLYLGVAVNFWKEPSQRKSILPLGRGRPPYRVKLEIGETWFRLETVR